MQQDARLVPQANFRRHGATHAGAHYAEINGTAAVNLELLETAQGRMEGSLYGVLCHCATPFGTSPLLRLLADLADSILPPAGKRTLREWLMHPLRDATAINARLDAVADLVEHTADRGTWTAI